MYTLFSRISLNDQNVKNALDYAEKYCYSFHLALLRCQSIIDSHIIFTESEESEEDDIDKVISDIIPIDDEDFDVLVKALVKINSMSFTYEKLHDIINDLVKIYYDKTQDDTFIKMRESYHYMCESDKNHETVRLVYVNEYYDMILFASILMNSIRNELESMSSFFSEECFDELKDFIDTHKDEVTHKELERIMKSNLEDWKTVFRDYV